MISRVAEACFWLQRYVERCENTARLLQVNRNFILDVELPELERWHPLIIVTGEERRFRDLFGPAAASDGEIVQEYLTWDGRSPCSIATSACWARENARTIREVISLEMWEALNGFWHWLSRGPGRRLYRRDPAAFYVRVKDTASLFQGLTHNTMLHEEPFEFMRLAILLERAGQTARILDVKHHTLGPTRRGIESPVELAHWTALLDSCSAKEPFLKARGGQITGRSVAAFLIKERDFPRSVLHCLERARNFLNRIRPRGQRRIGAASASQLDALVDRLRGLRVDEIFARGIHEELTRTIDATAAVCEAVHRDYFDPPLLDLKG